MLMIRGFTLSLMAAVCAVAMATAREPTLLTKPFGLSCDEMSFALGDDELLITRNKKSVGAWSGSPLALQHTCSDEGRFIHAYSLRANQQLAIGGDRHHVQVFDLENGARIARLSDHSFCRGIDFTPDGAKLVTGDDRFVRVWDTTTWDKVAEWRVHHPFRPVKKLRCSPNGKDVAVIYGPAHEEPDWFSVYDLHTGRVVFEPQLVPETCWDIDYSADGGTLYVTAHGMDGPLGGRLLFNRWDTETWEMRSHWFEQALQMARAEISADGRHGALMSAFSRFVALGVPRRYDWRVQLFDMETGTVLAEHPVDKLHPAAAFTPDGQTLAIAYQGEIVFRTIEELIRDFPPPPEAVSAD